MSEENFFRMNCGQCDGPLEFPAEAAGQTIDCPHCGKPLLLAAPRPGGVPRAATAAGAEPKVKMKSPTPAWDEPVALTPKTSHAPQAALLVGVLVLLGGGLWFYQSWKSRPKPAKPAAKQQAPAPVAAKPAPATSKEEPEKPHEGPDLQVLNHQIERAKDKGSKLVYVTGTLTNHVKAQYFSVKVEFELFDKSGKSLGKTSDQNSNIAGRTKWDFKALVLDESATKVELVKIHGEKE